jgi:uncharacterized membrane protein (DUF106 family)
MSKKNGKSSGEGIIKFANFLQVLFSILCVAVSALLIFVGITGKNGQYGAEIAQNTEALIGAGVFMLILGLIMTAIYAMFIRCLGEMAVDLHCIRSSNATIAEFIDRVEATKRAKSQQ